MTDSSKPSEAVIEKDSKLEHACDLAEWIGDLLFDDKTADVILIVEGECLPAHRAILSTSSQYFRALLQGNMKESLQDEIVLKDVPLRGLKILMSYIYTGQVKLGELEVDVILEILDIAHMYGYTKLESSLTEYLKKHLCLKNVCEIYSTAYRLKLEDLGEACYRFMIQEPNVTLKTEAFCDLSEAALCHVISQDTFHAEEIEIFEAVLRWRAKRQSEQDLGNVLKKVRLPLIDTKNLVTTVKKSGLVSTDLIVDAIEAKSCHAAERVFRGTLRNDVNLATSDCGALMLQPRTRGKYVAARSCLEYDSGDMPSHSSALGFPVAPGFTIALSEAFFINHIGFKLRHRSYRCAYYVEASVDLVNWVRIIDRTEYSHGKFQDLYFDRRVARYVRLVRTWASPNSADDITFKRLEVNYTTKPFKLSLGYYAPEENVASSERGAIVLESLKDSEALIKERKTDGDNNEVEWTSHDIGYGSIKIQLPQPYTVGSMRMLLRNDGSRAYLYYVETSLDDKTWTRVADRTTDLCRSMQDITFEPRPVLYINIVGTASTVDKIFSCSQFECPAPSQAPSQDLVKTDDNGSQNVKTNHV